MLVKELKILATNLWNVVENDAKFFAPIKFFVKNLCEIDFNDLNKEKINEMKMYADKIEEFFNRYRPSGNDLYIPPRQTAHNDSTVKRINEIIELLLVMPEHDLINQTAEINQTLNKQAVLPKGNCVFIGHGRNKLWAQVKIFLEDDHSLETIMYESESQTSKSIVSILEGFLDKATFAVIVVTAEDETVEGNTRARQNVIHEIGLFQGRTGFNKVVLLMQDGIEEFSNIAGLQYIPFSKDKIEQTFYELQRALKREGLIA